MTYGIPTAFDGSPWADRVRAALAAVQGAGAALMAMRGAGIAATEVDDQLKTAADLAAEGWVLGYLRGIFPHDAVLSEERCEADERAGSPWIPKSSFWVLDALDGTRSYAGGFDTFCVQIAWIVDGDVCVGVVHEPAADVTYVAVRGHGAYRSDRNGYDRLGVESRSAWPERPRFVDSTPPGGVVGEIMRNHDAQFVECGSIGLKICRVADNTADVYAKALRFKTWDCAPGELILGEAGGRLAQWNGEPVAYGTSRIVFRDIVAAPAGLFPLVAREILGRQAEAG